MRPNKTQGLLITFCGLDGCGKTTMIDKLVNDLNKKNSIFITKQPTEFVRQTPIFRAYMDSPNHGAYDYRVGKNLKNAPHTLLYRFLYVCA